MSIKVERVVTVLNKLGDSRVGAYVSYDDDSRRESVVSEVIQEVEKVAAPEN